MKAYGYAFLALIFALGTLFSAAAFGCGVYQDPNNILLMFPLLGVVICFFLAMIFFDESEDAFYYRNRERRKARLLGKRA